MNETNDRAALIAEAAKYPGDLWDSEAIAEASRLLAGLTAELADAEREIAAQAATIKNLHKEINTEINEFDAMAATIQAVRQWEIDWGHSTRRAMAREALEAILKG